LNTVLHPLSVYAKPFIYGPSGDAAKLADFETSASMWKCGAIQSMLSDGVTYERLPFFDLAYTLRGELRDERCTVRRDADLKVERRVSAKGASLIDALRNLHHQPSSSEHVEAIQIARGLRGAF
jgi:hypothetical protein